MVTMAETMFDINIMMVTCESCDKNFLSESVNNTLCQKHNTIFQNKQII